MFVMCEIKMPQTITKLSCESLFCQTTHFAALFKKKKEIIMSLKNKQNYLRKLFEKKLFQFS